MADRSTERLSCTARPGLFQVKLLCRRTRGTAHFADGSGNQHETVVRAVDRLASGIPSRYRGAFVAGTGRSSRSLLVLQGRHLGQAVPVAFGPAEAGGHKSLYEFTRQGRTDYTATHTKNVHVIVFDSLVC